jgi:hypothetical protein
MSVTLQPLLDLRALLDSLLSTCDNGSSSNSPFASRQRMLCTREIVSGYPAGMSVLSAECSATCEGMVTRILSDRPLNVPVNAESNRHAQGFQIHSEVV